MEKEDARYLKLEQLHERRKQVVRLHRKGHGVMSIVELTGLSYPAVRRALDLYEKGGAEALRRAYEQRPEAVQQWIDQEYPAIEKRAKAEGGEIHWGDETALVNTDVRGRSYAPKGQTPVTMAVGGPRQKLSMISTVTNQGKASWMIIDGAFIDPAVRSFHAAYLTRGS